MSKKYILQIVPYRSSVPDGIGDYATGIAAELRDRHNIHTVFIAASFASPDTRVDDGWPAYWLEARNKGELLDKMRAIKTQFDYSAILLHVAGYGYQKRGVPIWLLKAMKSWRASNFDQRFVGVFHELYAKGRITDSSFWLSALQKYVTRRIWLLCDGGITTNSLYLESLKSWRPGDDFPLALMPVVSSVGEPKTVRNMAQRQPHALVFGRAGVERALYKTHRQSLVDLTRSLGITKIIDIGSRHHQVPADIDGVPIEACGRLSAQDVSTKAQDCRFGFLAYDISRLGKSTIFAAYAANGVVPVCVSSNAQPGDGLEIGKHLYTEQTAASDLAQLQSMQKNIVSWYRRHDASRLGKCIVDLCFHRTYDLVGLCPTKVSFS